MNQRRRLLKLFLQNTGRSMVQAPRVESNLVRLTGYQVPRMDKYRWQGKL
jgi:hypothetical protein